MIQYYCNAFYARLSLKCLETPAAANATDRMLTLVDHKDHIIVLVYLQWLLICAIQGASVEF